MRCRIDRISVRQSLKVEISELCFVDQVTTSVPQGAKRLNDKMKASIRGDDEFEEDHSKVDRNEEKNEFSDQSSVEDTYQTNIKAKNEDYLDENGRSSANLRKGKADAYTVDTPEDYREVDNLSFALLSKITDPFF